MPSDSDDSNAKEREAGKVMNRDRSKDVMMARDRNFFMGRVPP